MTKRIAIRYKGKIVNYALVDEADYDRVAKLNWSLHPYKYAQARVNRLTLLMHRVVMGLERGDKSQVDHINGKVLDNRRCNLRIVTAAEQRLNSSAMYTIKNVKTTSRYRGVSRARGGNWYARMQLNGVQLYLGTFTTEIEAAKAYDEAAALFHGSMSCLNFGGGRRASLKKREWDLVAKERAAKAAKLEEVAV